MLITAHVNNVVFLCPTHHVCSAVPVWKQKLGLFLARSMWYQFWCRTRFPMNPSDKLSGKQTKKKTNTSLSVLYIICLFQITDLSSVKSLTCTCVYGVRMILTLVYNTEIIQMLPQYFDFAVHITSLRQTHNMWEQSARRKCVGLWECVMQTEILLCPRPRSLTPVQNVGSLGYAAVTWAVWLFWLKEVVEWDD